MAKKTALVFAYVLGSVAAGCGAAEDDDSFIGGATTGGGAGVTTGGVTGGQTGGSSGGATLGGASAGTNTGAGSTGSATSNTGDTCEEHVVSAQPAVPDILIVLDRSTSMSNEGRWDPSRAALVNITAS